MSERRAKQKRKTSLGPDIAHKSLRNGKAKSKPNIFHKYDAQVSQETFLEEDFEYVESGVLEPEKEFINKDTPNDETQEIIEELNDYEPDEIDTDDDGNLDFDESGSIFDPYDTKPLRKIQPDVILEEVYPYNDSGFSVTIDIFIPSKRRMFGRCASTKGQKEYEIRTEALEKIGNMLAKKDRDFLLNNVYNPSLITQKKQKEVARSIGKDETWITRLKQSCIIQTPRWGMQPLSIFFPEEIPSGVEDYSRQIIDQIDKENPFMPLSIKELAGLVSDTEVDYKALTINAGSKLRRVLEKLSIPPPKERMKLAEILMEAINIHKDNNNFEIIEIAKGADKKKISKLLIRYNSFSEKLIQKLKSRKVSL